MPSPLSWKATPAGSAPLRVSVVAVGYPAVVDTANDPAEPTVNPTAASLVNAGVSVTDRVKLCVASGSAPFEAVSVSG